MESLLIISMYEHAGVYTAPSLPAPAATRRCYSSTFLLKLGLEMRVWRVVPPRSSLLQDVFLCKLVVFL